MPTFNEPARPLEFLVSEANGSISREQVTIAVAAPAMVAGTVLGRITASGQWTVYNDGATDGTEVARGILAYDVADVAATQIATIIARHAEVKAAQLNWNAQAAGAITNGTADLLALEILLRAA
jgi:hypothetical protein